jgi:hypothetical protein
MSDKKATTAKRTVKKVDSEVEIGELIGKV